METWCAITTNNSHQLRKCSEVNQLNVEFLRELSDVRVSIIRKEADIESIAERVYELSNNGDIGLQNTDDLHRAKKKLKFEKERLVELKCHNAELEVLAVQQQFLRGLTDV